MDLERPQQQKTHSNTTSEFISFTSFLTNTSSMRLNSRSILSPARNNGGPTTLTTSTSRRLRRNGSLRGGAQSPALFPSAPTKRARGSSAFAENPEPSSPKVTCIGQVRVKTKKQGKKIKFRACGSKPPLPPPPKAAEDGGGKNTRWVHLPLSLCETIKGLGNDFSCLVPCKSSCFSDNNANDSANHDYYGNDGRDYRENEVKESISSCGTMFRWFVSLQDEGESGEKRSKVMERECSRRRSIFDDMEFDDLFKNGNDDVGGDCKGVEEGGRVSVSVCVPPKNALLLMRCRSDPMRMASLSRKFLEDPFVHGVDGDEDGDAVEVKEGGVVEVKEELEVREEEVMEVKVENRAEIDDSLEVREEEMMEMKEQNDDEVFQKLEVNENEVLDVKEDNHVRVHENLELGEEEIVEVKDDDHVRVDDYLEVGEEEMMETEVERKEVEECVELDEFEEAIDERLEIIEPKAEDLGVLGEELDKKLDENEDEIQGKSEDMRLEEMEENQGIENSENTEEEQIVEDGETMENADEAGEKQRIETSEKDGRILQSAEEIRLFEDDKYTNGCSAETFTVVEKVEGNENEQLLVKMLEDQIMELLKKEAEESYELSNSTSTSRTSFEESKELDPKEETITVEQELVEEETRKSIEKENNKPKTLPDCLLLMMCEPKLSLEVSKETWVCSTDFLRTLPEHRVSEKPNKTEGPDDQSSCSSNKKPKPAAVAAQPPQQPGLPLAQSGLKPGRSSISFPANFIEKKVAKAGVGYEPLVLTRCKSAPMRSAAKFELACSMWGSGCSRLLR